MYPGRVSSGLCVLHFAAASHLRRQSRPAVLAPRGPNHCRPAAEDPEATATVDLMAPATVTGTSSVVGTNQSSTTATGEPPVVTVTDNYGWTMRWETDDPRLSGDFETNQNAYSYGGGVQLRNGIGRLANEGGSWAVEFQGFTYGGFPNNHYINYLVGDGVYEGLTAIALALPAPGAWEVVGVIAPGPLPEPPEWILPPAE